MRSTRQLSVGIFLATLVLGFCTASIDRMAAQEPLLPDITVQRGFLFDYEFETKFGGQTWLSFASGTSNLGDGKLYLYGVFPANEDGSQTAMQRVFFDDGSFEDREVGHFEFHQDHGHVHVEGWTQYQLRELLPNDGVGEIVRTAEKTSFCILDLFVEDATLPNFQREPEFNSCAGAVQGLSVGWGDVYGRSLQQFDVTGLPTGIYWLESIADPDDQILELNEDNNVERIKITIGSPERVPDFYEPNESIDELEDRLPGAPRSPNLGPVGPRTVVEDLNIALDDEDFFRFYINSTGKVDDFVEIAFDHAQGNLELQLLTLAGDELASAADDGDIETISLEGISEGWYVVRVFSIDGPNPSYSLTIDPPENRSPSVAVLSPVLNELKLHGADSYRVRWAVSDPDSSKLWASVFLNQRPVLDENVLSVSTMRNVDAEIAVGIINSPEFPPGKYFIYCEVTDGGSVTGAWSRGTVNFLDLGPSCQAETIGDPSDCNVNLIVDTCEIAAQVQSDCNLNDIPDSCEMLQDPALDEDATGVLDACETALFHRGDPNGDGALDISDSLFLLGFLFVGREGPTCRDSADADDDGELSITDAIFMLLYLFIDGEPPPAPGPPGHPCGVDSAAPELPVTMGCVAYSECDV